MMTGTITNLRPHISLFVKGAGGQGDAEFTVDTGYNGTFTLPLADCQSLQLIPLDSVSSFLADGSQIDLESYLLMVE